MVTSSGIQGKFFCAPPAFALPSLASLAMGSQSGQNQRMGHDIDALDAAEIIQYCPTPLERAAALGDMPRLRTLLATLDPEIHADALASAYWRAAWAGQPHAGLAILGAGFSPNHRRPEAENDTPSSWACYHGRPDMLRALLAAGADPLALNDYGEGPMSLAAKYGHPECVRILLEAGVPFGSGRMGRSTPAMAAIAAGHDECLSLLLDAGLSPTGAADAEGHPHPLLCWAVEKDALGCIRLLAERGADLSERDEHGRTPLLLAMANGRAGAATLLAECGAKREPRDGSGPSGIAWTELPLLSTQALALMEEIDAACSAAAERRELAAAAGLPAGSKRDRLRV